MKYYLVTGAAGFIGSAVAKKLLEKGHKVVTIDNLSTGKRENIPDGCIFYEGCCQDKEIYKKIPDVKYDAILHIAGQSSGEVSFEDPIYDLRTNTESTLNIIKYCLSGKCERIIYASTVSVYGEKNKNPVNEEAMKEPKSLYGVGKLASEHYLRINNSDNLKTTSLRLFNVYGKGQNLENMKQGMISIYYSQLLKNKCIEVKGSLERYRDFVYIDDVVSCFIDSISNKDTYGKEINVCTGIKTTVGDVIAELKKIMSKDTPIKILDSTIGDVKGIYGCNHVLKKIFEKNKFIKLNEGLKEMIK